MGKILGIDWGEKLIGVAISDDLKIIAKPLRTINTEDFSFLREMIKDEGIEKVVVGRPRNMDGSLGVQARKVSDFVAHLKSCVHISVEYEDETNTTNIVKSLLVKEGINPQTNRELVNKKAAQLILQGYLDETKK